MKNTIPCPFEYASVNAAKGTSSALRPTTRISTGTTTKTVGLHPIVVGSRVTSVVAAFGTEQVKVRSRLVPIETPGRVGPEPLAMDASNRDPRLGYFSNDGQLVTDSDASALAAALRRPLTSPSHPTPHWRG